MSRKVANNCELKRKDPSILLEKTCVFLNLFLHIRKTKTVGIKWYANWEYHAHLNICEKKIQIFICGVFMIFPVGVIWAIILNEILYTQSLQWMEFIFIQTIPTQNKKKPFPNDNQLINKKKKFKIIIIKIIFFNRAKKFHTVLRLRNAL